MDSDEPNKPDVGVPAGQQLRQAREKLGLTQKDVADAQHLRVSIIEAIEDGNYQDIDSELFLKGYVRAYAQQVGVDADALVESLDVELEPLREERAKLEQENPLIDIERRRRKKRQLAKALALLLILGAAFFGVFKLVVEPELAVDDSGIEIEAEDESEIDSEPSGGNASLAQPDPEPESDQEVSPDVSTESNPEASQGASVSAVAEQQDRIASRPGSEQTETSPETDSVVSDELAAPAPGDVASADSTQTESSSPDTVNIEPVVQPDPVFEESAQPQAIAAPAQLEMSFVADCWVQVTDASGARLVASLQRAGEQVSVSGRAPIKVIIGAVDAVGEVTFSGEPISLSDYRVVNNRTEFTLSP